MNDLEICKRIAEIDSVRVFEYSHIVCGNVLCYDPVVTGLAPQPYNPLTDDALCFQLMVKYKISIDHEDCMCGKMVQKSNNHWEYLGNICYSESTSINKAILLAIIEAHKETNNESPG